MPIQELLKLKILPVIPLGNQTQPVERILFGKGNEKQLTIGMTVGRCKIQPKMLLPEKKNQQFGKENPHVATPKKSPKILI